MHWLHLGVPPTYLLQWGHLHRLPLLLAFAEASIIIIGPNWYLCLLFLLIDVDDLRLLTPKESHVFLFGSALVLFGSFIKLNLDLGAISFILVCLSHEEDLPPSEFKEAPAVPKKATSTTGED